LILFIFFKLTDKNIKAKEIVVIGEAIKEIPLEIVK
jgi:hypothetical protein